jgi:hypothetical protein
MNRPYSVPQCPHCSNLNRNLKMGVFLRTDHYLRESRDPSSRIVCPELIKTKCLFCFQTGHTKSHCPNIIKYWRSYKDIPIIEKDIKKSDQIDLSGNKFSLLVDDDSDTDESSASDCIYDNYGNFRPRSPDYPPPDWSE